MIDYIASLGIRLLNRVFVVVPIRASLWFGRRIGSVVFHFHRKRRLIAYANLKAAFAGEKTPEELRRITKRVYQNLLQTFVEIVSLTRVDKHYAAKYVEIVHMERIDNAAKSGKGTILLTAHFGCWELSSIVSALVGYPILVLAREQKMKRVNELLNQLRESKGCKVVRKGISTKNIIRALHAREIVGILADQDAGKLGTFVTFFGRPTSCHAGPMEIARRTGAIVLPNFIVRTKGPYHKVYLEEYITFDPALGEEEVRRAVQRFATILETYVRRYPEQWLWLHKRWKSTPVRTVLVLDDGKAGHRNQSLAVARQIQKARMTQGYRLDDTRIVVRPVAFARPWRRTLLAAAAVFANWRCHGRMRAMRFCLDREAYRDLMATYAEFVVSCGSATAAANVFMAHENNAKNIIIMKPAGIGLKKFTLAIVPEHDRAAAGKNVIRTVLAPNLINDEAVRLAGEALCRQYDLRSPGGFVGLFVGGDNPEFALTRKAVEAVLEGLLAFCSEENARLLVTTSRRTSSDVAGALKRRLAGEARAALLIIANEKNTDAAVGGILALSKAVVVSGESISMVSEAVSSGKKTVVFELAKRYEGETKHERSLRRLAAAGYLTIAAPDAVAAAVRAAWGDERPAKTVDDGKKIFDAVRRLI